jgi:hypothetical protein
MTLFAFPAEDVTNLMGDSFQSSWNTGLDDLYNPNTRAIGLIILTEIIECVTYTPSFIYSSL